MKLISSSRFIVTDSGGVQEEAVVFNKCCLVARNETEWTRLTDIGKNILATNKKENLIKWSDKLLNDDELNRIKKISFEFENDVSTKVVNIIKDFMENDIKK